MTLMINVRSVAVGEPATGATSDRRLYLAGGFGGVLAAASWLVQPFLVLVVATADEGEFPTVDFLLANPWYGPVEAAVFTGIGVGLLLLVLAVGALLAQRAAEVSVPALSRCRTGGDGVLPPNRLGHAMLRGW